MKKITSQDNKIFKLCIQLGNKKHRDRFEKYIIEGPNLIREALINQTALDFLVIDDSVSDNAEIVDLCNRYEAKFPNVQENIFVFEKQLFQKLSQTENSQGIFGVVEKPKVTEKEFFNCDKSNGGNILVLDRLQDPGNVGTIIRTADAAGYSGIIVLKNTVDIFSPKVVRACTGSLFRVPMLFIESPQRVIQLLKENEKRVISTGFDTDKYYYDVDLKKNVGLVIGNEGNGICDEFRINSDEVIKIPMVGIIESLNASVAAAIIMYEAMRKK